MLAPCLDFFNTSLWKDQLESKELEWLNNGSWLFHSHYYQRMVPIGAHFLKDMREHIATQKSIRIPTLVIHGMADDVVPLELSKQFSEANKNWAQLKVVQSDHRLENNMSELFEILWNFFQITKN